MENSELQHPQTAVSNIDLAKRIEYTKERITIRLDRDILAFFREGPQGTLNGDASDSDDSGYSSSLRRGARGYQSRINQALREYMQNSIKSMEETMRKVMREVMREELRHGGNNVSQLVEKEIATTEAA